MLNIITSQKHKNTKLKSKSCFYNFVFVLHQKGEKYNEMKSVQPEMHNPLSYC